MRKLQTFVPRGFIWTARLSRRSENTMSFANRHTPPHLLTLVLLAGLAALSMSIFLPSLAGMAEGFGVDYRVMQLSVSAYLGCSAGLQLLIGPVSDRFGRRPVILGALALFVLATLGTLLAPTAGWFLIFRMMQAVVATCMALSRAVVRDMSAGDEAASRIGYLTMGMSLVPMIGPVIGGALDEALGWRASFTLLGLLGLAVMALAAADLGETHPPRPDSGGLRAQIRSYPALLRSYRFWGYCAAATTASGAFFAYLGGASFVGAEIFHLPPATLGLYFTAPAIGYAIGNFLSGRYSLRIGMDRMVLIGALVATAALTLPLLLALSGLRHPMLFFPFVGLMALGNGMVLPNANAGMMSVRPELAGTASGLGGALNIGGGAALSALAGAALSPQSGAQTLLAIMLISSGLSIAAIGVVLWRNRQLGL